MKWNEKEAELIDQFLLSNRQKALFKLLQQFQCTNIDLNKKIIFEKEKLSHRDWTEQEDEMIIKNICGSISLKELRTMLVCRSNEQIASRKKFIKTMQEAYINMQS